MPKKEIVEKLDKIVENFLDAILEIVNSSSTVSVKRWKSVHNCVKSLSTLMKIRERINNSYVHQNQGLDPLMLLLMCKQPFNKINDLGSREGLVKELIKGMMSEKAVKGNLNKSDKL